MKNRFYDQNPHTAQAVKMMFIFPHELKVIIAEGLSTIAENEFRAAEIMQEYRSLGKDKVLALYKIKQKKREYDKDPVLHKAMMYLYLIPEESQVQLCARILELMGHLQRYMKLCKEHAVPTQGEHVSRIRDTYVTLGNTATGQMLDNFASQFLAAMGTMQMLEETGHEEIKSSEGGMKVRGEIL